MASRSRSIKRAKVLDEDKNRVIVETSRGIQLECHPIITEIEAQEENIRAQYEWPEPPTREIDGGVPADASWSGMVEMTQEHIDTDFSTDEEKETWAEYLKAYELIDAEFSTKMNDARIKLYAVDGVTVLNAAPEKEWIRKHEFMGMVVPEDPLERLMHYFKTEVLGEPGDFFVVAKGIYRSAGYDQEVLEELEQSFRSEVGRAGREILEGDQEDTVGEEPE